MIKELIAKNKSNAIAQTLKNGVKKKDMLHFAGGKMTFPSV